MENEVSNRDERRNEESDFFVARTWVSRSGPEGVPKGPLGVILESSFLYT